MTRNMITALVLAACCALTLGACGGEDEPSSEAAQGGQSCEDVKVPGHAAVDLKAVGAACAIAEKVAGAAEGRGRAAYEASGFACEPSGAGDGDTNYSCSRDSATVTFRYGTV